MAADETTLADVRAIVAQMAKEEMAKFSVYPLVILNFDPVQEGYREREPVDDIDIERIKKEFKEAYPNGKLIVGAPGVRLDFIALDSIEGE